MKEELYFPIMVLSLSYGNYFAPYLVDKIKEFKTPDGITITDVKSGTDEVLTFIFEQVRKKNYEPSLEEDCVEYEMDNYIYIEVETKSSLRYQKLTWLEEQIKDVVKDYDESVGIYFFHLNKELTFHKMEIVKVFIADDIKILEDLYEDNISEFMSYGPYLNHYWYLYEDISLVEAFPDLTAKFFLLFG